MGRFVPRKILLALLLVSFLIPLSWVPTTSAYGTTIDNPQLIYPGDFSETLLSIHESAYYKIYCAPDGVLNVNITFLTMGDLWIYIYDPNKWQVASAWEVATSQNLSYQPTLFGNYIIRDRKRRSQI